MDGRFILATIFFFFITHEVIYSEKSTDSTYVYFVRIIGTCQDCGICLFCSHNLESGTITHPLMHLGDRTGLWHLCLLCSHNLESDTITHPLIHFGNRTSIWHLCLFCLYSWCSIITHPLIYLEDSTKGTCLLFSTRSWSTTTDFSFFSKLEINKNKNKTKTTTTPCCIMYCYKVSVCFLTLRFCFKMLFEAVFIVLRWPYTTV